MEQRSAFLLLRIVVAVLLLILFVALALCAVIGLTIGGYYLGVFSVEHLRGRALVLGLLLAVGCVGAALVIVWSLVPRPDRFTPPGPELTPETQPELFTEIRAIAERTGQQAPAHVYLVGDVNAFVAERGGFMGLGSRRVMGVGLALMNILSVSELRAVLAHEFGHFFGGDTKLGPWVYGTRRALGRTLSNLQAAQGAAGQLGAALVMLFHIVLFPFKAFGSLYLRATQAISRTQELSADALAVRTEGATALIEGLKKTHRGALAFDAYMSNEVVPLLQASRLPPIGHGFRSFLDGGARDRLDRALENEIRDGKVDPHDSHPPLKDRIEHARRLSARTDEADDRPAVQLLRDIDAVEARLAAGWTKGKTLQQISWEASADTYVADWRKARKELTEALGNTTVMNLRRDPVWLRSFALAGLNRNLALEQSRAWATQALGSCLSALLLDAGFTATNVPGRPISLRREDGVTVEPFVEVARYLNEQVSAADWQLRWGNLGVGEVPLAVTAAPGNASEPATNVA
jgi:Zn-dependent protease with chaperone function